MNLWYDQKKIKNATDKDINESLCIIKSNNSYLILHIDPEPTFGPVRFSVTSNSDGFYLPVMSVNGEERGLREFYNEELYDTPAIVIGGNEWDPTFLTKDYDRICRMVWEFYETGNVTDELLQ